ncbi:MAG: hypothetical protein A3D65_04480 [Candidatus Lloydbacteria bacterium RIFCSPHIGHO2_02_FULL_50_13]|uniref:Uncharacterized protein n=1 Tax=Candidatus Lloydbacteria bacterium RIFCSPHIGHO2_02_FULL_50_13 TaxID=1798661 RepID=A0A1G2DAZ8_9BACT|nr:MAG: hypothetical protein A3D65_04480 [Candidatus Lloydbacteria bacterium RIFCSPHIGHO2_02_FULL_50_13]
METESARNSLPEQNEKNRMERQFTLDWLKAPCDATKREECMRWENPTITLSVTGDNGKVGQHKVRCFISGEFWWFDKTVLYHGGNVLSADERRFEGGDVVAGWQHSPKTEELEWGRRTYPMFGFTGKYMFADYKGRYSQQQEKIDSELAVLMAEARRDGLVQPKPEK